MFISDMVITVYDWVSAIQMSHSYKKMGNTLQEDMTTIMHSLIRGFQLTHFLDVIIRASLSYKGLKIGRLRNLSS
jgi:hypothetical protein